MTSVAISTKYQVVIPKEIRKVMHLKAGQKVTFLMKGGVVHLIPHRSIESLRGIAKGLDLLSEYREKKDRTL